MKNKADKVYLKTLKKILKKGKRKTDRTGTGTVSIFGPQMRFNLQKGFPLLTTKKVHMKSIIHELIWFLKGETNTKYLTDNGVTIWNEWQNANGDLGPVYGKQWRAWEGKPIIGWADDQKHVETKGYEKFDQIQALIDTLKNAPDSRRMIVSAWNVADLSKMALTPCHCLFQFYTVPLDLSERFHQLIDRIPVYYEDDKIDETWVRYDKLNDTEKAAYLDLCNVPKFRLDCQLYQRSADFFLGVPFNIASYALLTMMVAQVVNMVPGEFIWTGGDTHLYVNHFEQAEKQLAREPRAMPTMKLNPEVKNIFDFKFEDFTLEGYDPHSGIKAPVAV